MVAKCLDHNNREFLEGRRRTAKKQWVYIGKNKHYDEKMESYCVLLFRGMDFPFVISSVQAVVPWPIRGVTNGLCEHSRACRALRFFCEHEKK